MNSMTGHSLLGTFREAWLGSWQIFQDLQVGQDSEIRRPAVSRLESRVATNGSNLVPFLHSLYSSNRDFKNDVDMSMIDGSDLFSKLDPAIAYAKCPNLRVLLDDMLDRAKRSAH
jgi:predicted ATPase